MFAEGGFGAISRELGALVSASVAEPRAASVRASYTRPNDASVVVIVVRFALFASAATAGKPPAHNTSKYFQTLIRYLVDV